MNAKNTFNFFISVSAQATKCLPEASEIEVETGPYFGGKIASEKGDCEIEGDVNDPRDVYTMRIDHKSCGSLVSHNDLTVETYITVQENSGILTHSTRRFLVMCTFTPDTLTVRARLALPGKGGASAMEPDDLWLDKRSGRERQFKMVDKTALVLKESDQDERSNENAIPDIENLTEKIMSLISNPDNPKSSPPLTQTKKTVEYYKDARYSRLSSSDGYSNESSTFWSLHTHSIIGISIGIALSLVIVFIFVFLMQHESRKQRQNSEKLNNVYS